MSDIAGGDWAIEDWVRRAAKASGLLSILSRFRPTPRSFLPRQSRTRVVSRSRPIGSLRDLCLDASAFRLVLILTLTGIVLVCVVALVTVSPMPRTAAPALVETASDMTVAPGARPASRPALSSQEVTPVWTDIIKPIEIFNLEAADLAKTPRTYTAKRNATGGRRDVIALGTLTGVDPAMRLALYRQGQETVAATPIFADVAHLAAEAGLSVTRSGLADLMPTRFGAFEVIAIGLTRGTGAAVASCSGFRLKLAAPAFGMTGLACGGMKPLTRDRLSCMLDRTDLLAGGGDRPLIDFFAASELKRDNSCDGMRLGPDMVHASRDDQPVTPRKNRRHRLETMGSIRIR